PVVVKVTDRGIPAKSTTNSFVVVVREVNRAPVMVPVGDRTMAELEELEIPLETEDGDLPRNGLRYQLVSGPAGMTVSEAGVLRWVPTEEQGPMETDVVVTVTDDGVPPLSATNQFHVTVVEENHPPLFLEISDQTIPELQPFEFSILALDSDIPSNGLRYSLIQGPVGLKVSPQGVVTWTPTEAQGPSTNRIVVQVMDDGIGALTATNQFTIVVLEINSPPLLFPVADVEVPLGEPVLIPLDVSDEDEPRQDGFVFEVLSGDPTAIVDSVARVFEWTALGMGDYSFEVGVADSGLPQGTDRQRFTIHVTRPVLTVRVEGGRVFVEFESLWNWRYDLLSAPYSARAESRGYWSSILPSLIPGDGSRQRWEVPITAYEGGELLRLEAIGPPDL
ncbi:MAG: cadherin repeat domain-containing protein, partial [Verrucomicrobiales bacterium]|nr:cadherin repeat domain-containing protein [Verrucomicrobiales bacterium]